VVGVDDDLGDLEHGGGRAFERERAFVALRRGGRECSEARQLVVALQQLIWSPSRVRRDPDRLIVLARRPNSLRPFG